MKVSLVTTLVFSTAALMSAPASAQFRAGVQVQVAAPPPPSVVITAPVFAIPPPPQVVFNPPVVYAPTAEPEVYAMQPPPPMQVEAPPPMPGPGFVWRGGYWRWAGNQYLWAGGHWEQPPQAGYGWVEPRWGMRGGRWRFTRGRWGAGVAQPAYVQPAVAVAPPVVYAPAREYGRPRGGAEFEAPRGAGVVAGPGGGAVYVRPRGHGRGRER